MAEFSGVILTTLGRNLLAKAQTGTTLNFARVAIGDGLWTEETDPEALTALIGEQLTLPIQDHTVVGDGTSELQVVLTNSGLVTGFFVREIGLFATDPDLGEILYAVTSAGDRADFLPADSGTTTVEEVIKLITVVGNASSVTAEISDHILIATREDLAIATALQSRTHLNILHRELTRHFQAVQALS